MIRIQIESAQMEVRKGTSSRTGQPYEIREQRALMFRDGEQYPDKIKITVRDGMSAYAPGFYTFSDSSYQVSRFASVELRPVLVALQAKASSPSQVA